MSRHELATTLRNFAQALEQAAKISLRSPGGQGSFAGLDVTEQLASLAPLVLGLAAQIENGPGQIDSYTLRKCVEFATTAANIC